MRVPDAFETGSEARAGIARWIDFYNPPTPAAALAVLRTRIIKGSLIREKTN